ncbi:MAG: GNAT family N-acetyltransferase [Suilimivivens sp.]
MLTIRRAEKKDINEINCLLRQVLTIHHQRRPDLFQSDSKKYTDEELLSLIKDDLNPIFVAENESHSILGYAMCKFVQHRKDNILTDIKSLYIDDLCVDENSRGKQIGKQLFEFVSHFAKKEGCYNLTLNVWACNENARIFYEKCGLFPQKIGMEKIL